jgi:uncharacterized protein (UPF0261 family)
MAKTIVVIGTLDTKGDQFAYLKKLIEERGHRVLLMDVGVLGEPPFAPEINSAKVARAGGSSLEELRASRELEPKAAMDRMTQGALKLARELYDKGEMEGVVAGGGSMGTALGLEVMKALPLGVPKLVVSTIAYSAAILPDFVGGSDVMMLPWIAGLWGLNSIAERILRTAAGAISGAAEAYQRNASIQRKTVAVTAVGGSVQGYMGGLKRGLEERGYEVAVFHGTGMSGRVYEKAIADGFIVACVDMAVGGELTNYVAGGVCSAGANRLEAAGAAAIPQIVSADRFIFHWWSSMPLPEKYGDRERALHNTLFGPVRCSSEEAAAVAELMAEKLNRAKGPVAVVIAKQPPRHGAAGGIMRPEQWQAFRERFLAKASPGLKVLVYDGRPEEGSFVEMLLGLFDEMMQGRKGPI